MKCQVFLLQKVKLLDKWLTECKLKMNPYLKYQIKYINKMLHISIK